jgi:hypothetical protein
MLFFFFTITLINIRRVKMKKSLVMSLAVASLFSAANAADDLSSMFKDGKASGQIRLFSIDRLYEGSAGTTTHRNTTAAGGNLKYETADYKGLSLGTTFYTTNAIAGSPTVEPSMYGPNNKGYSILGEAYVQYKYGKTTFKGGRQKLDTPLAGSDDARMLPNLFEAYLLMNSDVKNTTLVAGQVTRFAQGSFGRVYSATATATAANKLLSATAGYSYADSLNQAGDFVNMGQYAVGQSTNGVTTAAAIYANGPLKAQVWDYYASNILNAVYADATVSWNCLLTDKIKPSFSAQAIKENAIGDRFAGNVNSFYAAGKFDVKAGDASAYVAYSEQSKSDAPTATGLEKATVTPWGGMPAYTQGMVTRHQFMAGTKATKIAVSYDFKNMGANVLASAYYTSFNMDANSGYGIARTATEPGFDLAYKPAAVKNLELKLRGNFPRKFVESTSTSGDIGWNEYRLIANYNF